MDTVPRTTRSRAKVDNTPLVSLESISHTANQKTRAPDSLRKALFDVTNELVAADLQHKTANSPAREAKTSPSLPKRAISEAGSSPKARAQSEDPVDVHEGSDSDEAIPANCADLSEECRRQTPAEEPLVPTPAALQSNAQSHSPLALAASAGVPEPDTPMDCFHPKLELEGITADALLDRWCLGHGSDADTPATTSPPWKLAAQVPSSNEPRPSSRVIVASPDKFDPRSIRQLKKEVKAAMQPAGDATEASDELGYLGKDQAPQLEGQVATKASSELCAAMGSLEISARPVSEPEPLKGMPLKQGRHTRFEFEDNETGRAIDSPQRPMLRGIAAAKGSHLRFDE